MVCDDAMSMCTHTANRAGMHNVAGRVVCIHATSKTAANTACECSNAWLEVSRQTDHGMASTQIVAAQDCFMNQQTR